MFCWELALQIRRDCLPALHDANVKLFAVGIGSADSAKTFAEKIAFPAEILFADESDETEAHAAVGTRNTQRDANNKQIFEGVDSMWSRETNDAIKARGRDDLNAITGNPFKPGPYVPLMPKGNSLFDPKALERTMVQGGTFIFEGGECLFSHFDASSGAHADLDEVVRLATERR